VDIYASDEEKGEEIKQWWKDNGRSVILGCVFGAAIIFSGRYWFSYQDEQALTASQSYQELVSLLAQDNMPLAETISQKLLADFSSTPYAIFSAFEMAAYAVKSGDSSSAPFFLNWIMEHAGLAAHKELARLRLAKVLVGDAQYEEALSLILDSDSQAYSSLFTELKGDILVAQGNISEARAAYESTRVNLIEGEPRKQLLQIKLNDIAG